MNTDEIYLPLIWMERKIFFEHEKYGHKVTWDDADALEVSMNEIISDLQRAKERYRGNNVRNGCGGSGTQST